MLFGSVHTETGENDDSCEDMIAAPVNFPVRLELDVQTTPLPDAVR